MLIDGVGLVGAVPLDVAVVVGVVVGFGFMVGSGVEISLLASQQIMPKVIRPIIA